jgi:hypothetical protein
MAPGRWRWRPTCNYVEGAHSGHAVVVEACAVDWRGGGGGSDVAGQPFARGGGGSLAERRLQRVLFGCMGNDEDADGHLHSGEVGSQVSGNVTW